MFAVRERLRWNPSTGTPVLLTMLAVLLTACSDEPTAPVERPVVAAVDVTPSAMALTTGDTIRLRAIPRTSSGVPLTDRPVTWSSRDTTRATVQATGLVLARREGFVEIQAVAEGRTGTATLTIVKRVTPAPAVMRVSPTSVVAGSGPLTLSVFGSDFVTGAAVLWDNAPRPTTRVNDAELSAAISAADVATARTVQVAVRNPEPAGGVSGAIPFIITSAGGPTPVAYVSVSPESVTLPARAQTQLRATAHAADGTELSDRAFSWSSLGPATATVDQTGTVTAHRPGDVRIRVESEGKTAHADIHVIPAVEYVTVAPNAATLSVGQQIQLFATAYAADGSVLQDRAFTWTTTAGGTASVDQTGFVTARHVGVALITAESEGRFAQARIDVVVPVGFVIVEPSPAAVLVELRVKLEAKALSSSGGVLEGRPVTWSSENPSIATVEPDGWVTGVKKGTTRVFAEIEGKVGWSTVEVRQFADGPIQAYDLRGPVSSPIMPSVGTRTWVDEQGFAHEATLYLRTGVLRMLTDQSRYEQDLQIDVFVTVRGMVGTDVWSDHGTFAYHVPDGGLLFTSSVNQTSFTGLPAGPGELIIEQAIGTAPKQYYRWVIQ